MFFLEKTKASIIEQICINIQSIGDIKQPPQPKGQANWSVISTTSCLAAILDSDVN